MGRARILVVEDEPITAMAIKATLLQFGYDVVGSEATGEGAVEVARRASPDVVLMDIHLKGEMDGIKAADIIRHETDAPVVYITAFSDPDTLARAKVAEPYGYIVKPFTDAELRAVVEIATHNAAMERARRASESSIGSAMLQSIFDLSPGAIYITRADGVVTMANRSANLLFARGIEPMAGRPATSILPLGLAEGDARAFFSRDVTHAREEVQLPGGPRTFLAIRFPMGRADRAPVAVCTLLVGMEASLAPRSGDQPEILSVLVSPEEAERAAREVRALSDDIERTVDARAQDPADEFAQMLAHDLRAPARGIDVFAEELETAHAEALGEGGRGLVHQIRSQTQRLMQLLGAVMSTRPTIVQPIELAPVDLSALASDVSMELARREPKDRVVQFEIEPELIARGDELLLRLALENLISNALKFSAGRDITRVRIGGRPPTGKTRVFFVEDNGPGFDPSQALTVFEAFHRLPNAEGVPGSGLGLSSVKRTIERHGGKVWAEGRPGEGATVFFELPL